MTAATLRHAGWILRGNPLTAVAAAGVFLLTLIAIFGPWIVPYPDDARGAVHLDQKLRPPGAAHWFGTDEVGNDVYTRVVLGARVSLQIGLIITVVAALIGVPLGIVAGYVGGGRAGLDALERGSRKASKPARHASASYSSPASMIIGVPRRCGMLRTLDTISNPC